MTTYIFRWDRHGRKGQRCVVLVRGTMISCEPPRASFSCCKFAPLAHRQPETDQDRQANTYSILACVLQIRCLSRSYGLSQCSIECLLATLNCSSAGGGPIVAQNKTPKSVAEKIMMAISLKYIGPTPH
jgi:hypothetical protein